MTPTGDAAIYAIAFMAAGVFLTVAFFVGAALIVVGHFKPSRRLQRAGGMVLATWALPAAAWTYHLQVLTEKDQYLTLSKPETVYGVPLPAGTQVNYHRWARRVQWVILHTPQTIQDVDYIGQVDFCGKRVCSGILARNQDIQDIPCHAQAEVHFAEKTSDLTSCTLARQFTRQGVAWPARTVVVVGPNPSYQLPQGAEPVSVAGVLVHSGLIVQFGPNGKVTEIRRNRSRPNVDTLLEAGDILLKSDQYRFLSDGTIRGGILVRDAIIKGKPTKAGEPVILNQPPATSN
jgi:hypothetical protein